MAAEPRPPERIDRLAYSPAEAARALGISRAKLYLLLDEGALPSIRLGRRRLIRVVDLEAMLERGAVA